MSYMHCFVALAAVRREPPTAHQFFGGLLLNLWNLVRFDQANREAIRRAGHLCELRNCY
jgi:hypothetical protein